MSLQSLTGLQPAVAASANAFIDEGLIIQLEEKIATLSDIFPSERLIDIREALERASGSLYWAIDHLTSSPESRIFDTAGGTKTQHMPPGASLQSFEEFSVSENNLNLEIASRLPRDRSTIKEQQQIKQLQGIFPYHSNAKLRTALSKGNWDPSLAAENLASESSLSAMSEVSYELEVKPRTTVSSSSSSISNSTEIGKTEVTVRPNTGAPLTKTTKTWAQNLSIQPFRENESANGLRPRVTEVIDLTETIVRQSIEEQAIEEKIEDLMDMICGVTYEQCAATLEESENNMIKAYHALNAKVRLSLIDESGFQKEDEFCENGHSSTDEDHSDGKFEAEEKKGRRAGGSTKLISSGKRRGQRLGKLSTKRPRLHTEEDGKAGDENDRGMPPASEWVMNTFSENDGIMVRLFDGIHPRTFPKSLLGDFLLLNDIIKNRLRDVESGLQIIEVSDVTREHWDLVLQWAGTKKLVLCSNLYPNTEAKITGLLELAFTGISMEIAGLNAYILDRLQREMTRNRGALKGKHIRRAFELRKNNPIRQLFVKAALRSYFVYHNPEFTSQQQAKGGSSEHRDAAHKAAIYGNQYMFQAELDSVPDFELAMLKEMRTVMVTRQVLERRGGRTTWIFYTDPLTNESFKMCSCS